MWHRHSLHGLCTVWSSEISHRRGHVRYDLWCYGYRQVTALFRFFEHEITWLCRSVFQREQYRWIENYFPSRSHRRCRSPGDESKSYSLFRTSFLFTFSGRYHHFRMDGYERLPWRTVDSLAWKSILGYFLLFECMLESIIFARNHYLDKENGLGEHRPVRNTERMTKSLLVLPDDFSIHLSGFHSESLYHENVGFWSDVYGFEMNTVAKNILLDGHVMVVPANDLMTDDCCIKVDFRLFERRKSLRRCWIEFGCV